jgi:hypothetical protein
MATQAKPRESKDVEMKDEEKKAEEPDPKPDPKQVQKDKDLLTFEGVFYLMHTTRILRLFLIFQTCGNR